MDSDPNEEIDSDVLVDVAEQEAEEAAGGAIEEIEIEDESDIDVADDDIADENDIHQ